MYGFPFHTTAAVSIPPRFTVIDATGANFDLLAALRDINPGATSAKLLYLPVGTTEEDGFQKIALRWEGNPTIEVNAV
jgi:hypothetical protein